MIIFEEIFKKSWDSKSSSIFFSSWEKNEQKPMENGFHALFNEDLVNKKRNGKIMQDSKNLIPVDQNFDENAFSFQKIDLEEVLVGFRHEAQMGWEVNFTPDNFTKFDHFAILNKSPICKYHSLLVPFLHEKLPQKMDSDALVVVLQMFNILQGENNNMRVGFNSLGGFSSINHLHFHIVLIEETFPETKYFPIEAATKKLMASFKFPSPYENSSNISINVNIIEDYPVSCLFVNILEEINENTLNFVGDAVGAIISYLWEENVAHNVMISEKGKNIYIFPRQNQGINQRRKDFQCAWMEICGLAICKNQDLFRETNYKDYCQFLKENIGYGKPFFEDWIKEIMNHFNGYLS